MERIEHEQTIVTYNAYLERIVDSMMHFCEDLLESNYQDVSEVLPMIIDGMSWINEALEGYVNLGYVPAHLLNEFHQVIHGLHGALENKDYVLLYDLFEFEIIPLLKKLKIQTVETN